MNTHRTTYLIGITFATILFTILIGYMGLIVMSGGLDMLATVHASIPLLAGPSRVLHRCTYGDTIARSVHLDGATILNRVKDRDFSVPVTFDGEDGHARLMNRFTDLISREKTYKVSAIFDEQEYRHGDVAFMYIVKESV